MRRFILTFLLLIPLLLPGLSAAEPLRVCCSIPDLGEIAKAVGGADVEVTIFARGGDDPHFVEARPSFAKALSRADLLVTVGLELEVGWIPVVQGQARNPKVVGQGPGYLEAASAIHLLGVHTGTVDRSQGDVHSGGNPHFLVDPVAGVRVARLLRDRCSDLAPERAEHFAAGCAAFTDKIAQALIGPVASGRDAAALIDAVEQHRLPELLGADVGKVAGWLGALAPYAGTKVVCDHDLWPYFAQRFGLRVVGFLEPKPGVPPTTRHLAEVIETMKAQQVKAILTVPYFDARHAAFVSGQTAAAVATLAHQVGATPDSGDYLAMVDHNVRALVTALGSR